MVLLTKPFCGTNKTCFPIVGSPSRVQTREGDCQKSGVWWTVCCWPAEWWRSQRSLGQTGYFHTVVPGQLLGQVCQEEGMKKFSSDSKYVRLEILSQQR